MPHNVPGQKRTVFKYNSEKDQALKAKRTKPAKRALDREQHYATRDVQDEFGPRNPDGSKHIVPDSKSKRNRPA